MIRRSDLPDIAICHRCGEPMQVVDLSTVAKELGYQAPAGSYVLECCGFEQTIDNRAEAELLLDLLLAYHAQKKQAS